MPVPRRTQLRLRPRCRLRLRPGAASAAKDFHQSQDFDGSIGEQVKRLRNSCTGQKPVHFFVKVAGAAAGVLLAAAPLSYAHAAAALAPVAQSTVGQSIDDFYRARNGAPLWPAPTAGDAPEPLLTLLGTASIDGLEPDKYHAAALQQAIAAARGGKPKDVAAADRALS